MSGQMEQDRFTKYGLGRTLGSGRVVDSPRSPNVPRRPAETGSVDVTQKIKKNMGTVVEIKQSTIKVTQAVETNDGTLTGISKVRKNRNEVVQVVETNEQRGVVVGAVGCEEDD